MFPWPKKRQRVIPIPDSWPKFVDGKVAVARWTHPDGRRRVYVISRADGLFSLWSEHFSEEEFEMCWIPEDRGGSFFDSEKTAVKEILSAYPWSGAVVREEHPRE